MISAVTIMNAGTVKAIPDGLAGTAIPLSARVVAIVDVYDALVSERCYKKAYSHEQAINILKQGAGNHFDPDIINTLLEVEAQFKSYEQQLS